MREVHDGSRGGVSGGHRAGPGVLVQPLGSHGVHTPAAGVLYLERQPKVLRHDDVELRA